MECTFLCIWYENRCFWVHEVKRLGISFYMALCIPIHLRQRTSRVYQDHPTISDQVLTSLVPPVHNQGVSSAPNQGHMPYGKYSCRLLAHSLYVLLLTSSCNSTFQWTFSCYIPFFSAVVADLSIQAFFTQMLNPTTIYCFLIFFMLPL